jgi:hypothetical protein
MGERSRLAIPVGGHLKDEFGPGARKRLRLEVVGPPSWDGDLGRLEIHYDEVDDPYSAFQPVGVSDDR